MERSHIAQTSLFLIILPAELRNIVYHLVLVLDKEVVINTATVRHQRAILQTCKQMREETMKIYYGRNSFRIPVPQGRAPRNMKPVRFFTAAGRHQAENISRLAIEFGLSRKQAPQLNRAVRNRNDGISDINNESLRNLVKAVKRTAVELGRALAAVGISHGKVQVEPSLLQTSAVSVELAMICVRHFEADVLKCLAEDVDGSNLQAV